MHDAAEPIGKRRWLMVLLVVAVTGLACERDPGVADSSGAGAMPVLVAQARRGSFVVERRFTGQARALGDLEVTVREPGEVVEVPAPADSQPVRAGQPLLRLRSPDLELEVREAQAVLAAAEVELERQGRLVGLGLAARTGLDATRTTLDRARIYLERLQLRLARLEVRAPAHGLLVHGDMPEPGQYCAAGTGVARVVDPGSVVVEVAVPAGWSEHAREVRQGALELGDAGEVTAVVVAFSVGVPSERGGRILTLKPVGAAPIVPGATIGVRLLLASRADVVTVPAGAIVADGEGGLRVAVGPAAGEQGQVRWRPVVAGRSDGERTVVEQGLEGQEWVVVARELSTAGWWGWGAYIGVGQ